ncbi:CoA transferase [Alicyclobacillus tolerans]|uniref:CaiB/BaiF CoA transferase family protein n=1 Tax=Alicyclobacillus tolerans TaxID=90970 RepID=UPI001F1BF019|nr:CaiB/BaiF CoA-transferase family protein [Alicyclobacillus tolerans]MCF8565301.1 CoA transferase [Alicyclobacillus tolerans]
MPVTGNMPLTGIKVLDLTRLLPGPYATLMLADFGADVIKIEEPGQGDYARWYQPLIGGKGSRHLFINRNKQSVTLNLKTEEGKEIFHKMAHDADVVIESFRPGVVDRLGIGYEAVKAHNPGVIYCSLTGYGQTGPYAQVPGHDLNYVGYSGALSLNGTPESGPTILSVPIADLAGGGQMAVIAILLALQARHRTQQGQYLDVSMLDGVVSLLYTLAPDHFAKAVVERGRMPLNGRLACYQVYQTADGKYLALGAREAKFWRNFCTCLGRPDLIERQNGPDEEQAELKRIVQDILWTKTQQEWMDIFSGRDTCCTPVNDLNEAFSDPQVLARDMLQTVDHPKAGIVEQIGIPIKLSETPGSIRTAAPELGEHTRLVLEQLGYSTQEIEALKGKGVV